MKEVYEAFKLHICVWLRLVSLVFICSTIAACGVRRPAIDNAEKVSDSVSDSIVAYAGTYDSLDEAAIVLAVDIDEKQVTLFNRSVNKQYTLSFNGASKFFDKYGTSLVAEQIQTGDVVDVTFRKNEKTINSLQKSPSAWVYSDVKEYTIDALSGNIRMMDGDYKFKDTLQIFSDGMKATLMDINEVDSLVLSGSGREVYSITVGEGHGYLRLNGQDKFIGGWIEIGTGIIKSVTEDMLLTVPVGTYEVHLSKGKYDCVETVSISKGKESLMDVTGRITEDEQKYGDIIFVVTPNDTTVYIDGKEVDITKPVKVEYGIHQLIARAENYDTITQYIKVGQEHATLEITLDKSSGKDKKENSSSKITAAVSPSVIETEASKYRVKIEAPEGAEVFLDGSYVGVVPVDFAKVAGNHTITLRKEGYETRSYTITLDNLQQNESYSFALLKEIGSKDKNKVPSLPPAVSLEKVPEEDTNKPENPTEDESKPVEDNGEQSKEPEKDSSEEEDSSKEENSNESNNEQNVDNKTD